MPATAPQGFRSAARKKDTRPTIHVFHEWTDDEDESVVIRRSDFHATMPSDEQMFLIAALMGDEDNSSASATAMVDLFRAALPSDEFRDMKSRLADPEDPLDMEILTQMMEHIMKGWTTFPTGPSSGSSQSPTSSGTKSTGRVRGKGSILSDSPSSGS